MTRDLGNAPRAALLAAALTAWFAPCAGADLLVGSNRTSSVLRFDATTGGFLGEFIAGGSGGLVMPGGLAVGPDGNLYVASNGTNQILRYDGTTGAFLGVFAAGKDLDKPSGIRF